MFLTDFCSHVKGDHSQPHTWPSWFGRPLCNLFLTDCDVVYGRAVGSNHRGDYDGSLKLPVIAGYVSTSPSSKLNAILLVMRCLCHL